MEKRETAVKRLLKKKERRREELLPMEALSGTADPSRTP
jgi:hypothetical protein